MKFSTVILSAAAALALMSTVDAAPVPLFGFKVFHNKGRVENATGKYVKTKNIFGAKTWVAGYWKGNVWVWANGTQVYANGTNAAAAAKPGTAAAKSSAGGTKIKCDLTVTENKKDRKIPGAKGELLAGNTVVQCKADVKQNFITKALAKNVYNANQKKPKNTNAGNALVAKLPAGNDYLKTAYRASTCSVTVTGSNGVARTVKGGTVGAKHVNKDGQKYYTCLATVEAKWFDAKAKRDLSEVEAMDDFEEVEDFAKRDLSEIESADVEDFVEDEY
jgi:hypothetical protein